VLQNWCNSQLPKVDLELAHGPSPQAVLRSGSPLRMDAKIELRGHIR
jgi:hypothetical protein